MRVLLAAVLAMATIASASGAAPGRQIVGSEQDHSLAGIEINDCVHFYTTTFTSFRAQTHEQEQREFALTGDKLEVTAGQEGSVTVRGWNRPDARLIICRFAASHTKAQASRVLGSVAVSHANGEISASGPAADINSAWWVNMILYVPRKATLDIRATSGGVAIRNMSGNVTASATSGGISVAQSSGRYKISTNIGGITLDRVTGNVDASSQRGAIALRLPAAAGSSVEAKIAEGGEILCTLRGCDAAQWSPNHRELRLGAGAPQIRLSTVAAPILIGPVTF
ncbi:MAG TPA: DUF4097 family beta strand repeat-containing protein [Thermoanaerobaculia bacterium]